MKTRFSKKKVNENKQHSLSNHCSGPYGPSTFSIPAVSFPPRVDLTNFFDPTKYSRRPLPTPAHGRRRLSSTHPLPAAGCRLPSPAGPKKRASERDTEANPRRRQRGVGVGEMKNLRLVTRLPQQLQLQIDGETLVASAIDAERRRAFFASSANFIYTVSLPASFTREQVSQFHPLRTNTSFFFFHCVYARKPANNTY
jgi:hypothetical protein